MSHQVYFKHSHLLFRHVCYHFTMLSLPLILRSLSNRVIAKYLAIRSIYRLISFGPKVGCFGWFSDCLAAEIIFFSQTIPKILYLSEPGHTYFPSFPGSSPQSLALIIWSLSFDSSKNGFSFLLIMGRCISSSYQACQMGWAESSKNYGHSHHMIKRCK